MKLEKKEKEELKWLHDYVVDDLSIEYHSSKELYEDIKSLRRRHGLDEETKERYRRVRR